MKNQKYYVLKTIYKLSQKNNKQFISKASLLSKNCPEDMLSYLDFNNFLNYKRENKTDYYGIAQQGIDYLIQHKYEIRNLALSAIAAISSIIGIIVTFSN